MKIDSSKKDKNRKYIFVVGGVMSGVGKGVASASMGAILKSKGFNVTAIKIDPYINIDAGTMNPTVHGEVFVLKDGDETDQDMGTYERFLGIDLTKENYMTTGRVYLDVIKKERNLEYGGSDVKVIPEIPEQVIYRIKKASDLSDADITIVEIGGTVGEYENLLFLDAVRMFQFQNHDDVAVVMVSYLPTPPTIGEMKTKPTQHAIRALMSAGIHADIVLARGEFPLDEKRKEKIANLCNVRADYIISAPDVKSIYEVPINFEKEELGNKLTDILGLERKQNNLSAWKDFADLRNTDLPIVKIAVVGKYFSSGDFILSDVYLSVLEAIKFSAYNQKVKPEIVYFDSVKFEENPEKISELFDYSGILIPGGFGQRGIEGKINVIKYARENMIPYFGLCYGMQLMVIEYARNVLGLKDANTLEIDPESSNLVINIMQDQKEKVDNNEYGGTMRLGQYPASLKKGTIAEMAYGKDLIQERHRHRFEVNNAYVDQLEASGLVFSGTSPDGKLMEIAELPKDIHPFFLGTQYHPEFTARPLDPHPLFTEFIKASKKRAGIK